MPNKAIAIILAVFICGLGHIYLRRYKQGIPIFVAGIILMGYVLGVVITSSAPIETAYWSSLMWVFWGAQLAHVLWIVTRQAPPVKDFTKGW